MDEQVVLKHGGLGIASFTISVIVLILIFALIAVAAFMKTSNVPVRSAANAIVGLFFILLLFTDLIGIGLGIAGAIQKKSKKVFPVLGIVIGTGTIVMAGLLMMIGLQAAPRL